MKILIYFLISDNKYMSQIKDLISKGLLTGALNSLTNMLIFEGTGRDIVNFRIPYLGDMVIPDAVALALFGGVGQVASDLAHDYFYKTINTADKMKSSQTAIASLASYNIAQLPLLYLGGMVSGNIAPYLLASSGAHYAGESIYHDVLDKRTGGFII